MSEVLTKEEINDWERNGKKLITIDFISSHEALRTKLADAQSKLENKSRVNLKLEHQLQNVNANLDIAVKALQVIDESDSFYSTKQCDVAREALLAIQVGLSEVKK